MTLGVLATCIDMQADVKLITSAMLMSLIYGNVVGYIMDVAIGSDSGLKLLKEKGGHASLRFAIKSMAGPNFQRYIVCTMLDAYISTILVDKFVTALEGVSRLNQWVNCNPTKKMTPVLLTILVSTITFFAYTNGTRFRFAIKNDTFPLTPLEFARRARKSKTLAFMQYDDEVVTNALSLAEADDNQSESFADVFGMTRDEIRTNGLNVNANDEVTQYVMLQLSKELRTNESPVDSMVIFLATSIAACMYLMTKISNDEGMHAPIYKTINVIVVFALMCYITMSGKLNESPTTMTAIDEIIGWGLLIAFTTLCIGLTLSTSNRPDKRRLACLLIAGLLLAFGLTCIEWGGSKNLYSLVVTFVITLILFYIIAKTRISKKATELKQGKVLEKSCIPRSR